MEKGRNRFIVTACGTSVSAHDHTNSETRRSLASRLPYLGHHRADAGRLLSPPGRAATRPGSFHINIIEITLWNIR
jgi:hypothetical protein